MEDAVGAMLGEADLAYSTFVLSKDKPPVPVVPKNKCEKPVGMAKSRLLHETMASSASKTTPSTAGQEIHRAKIVDTQQEKKIDYLVKRMTYMEEKVKRLQEANAKKDDFQDRCELLESEIKSMKSSESKRTSVMNDQIKSMKQQISILLRKDELIAEKSHNDGKPHLIGETQVHLDAKALADSVMAKVNVELNKRMEEVLSICMKEQSVVMNKWAATRLAATEERLDGTDESLRSIGQRHKDMERELSDCRVFMEGKQEELMDAMHYETKTIFETIGRKVNEGLVGSSKMAQSARSNASQLLSDSRFETLRDEFLSGLKSQQIETGEALGQLGKSQRESDERIADIEMKMSRVSAQTEHALSQANAAKTQSASKLPVGVPASVKEAEDIRERNFVLKQEGLKVDSALKTLFSNMSVMQGDVESAHIVLTRHEERMQDLAAILEETRLDSKIKINNLADSEARMRQKLQGLADGFESLSHTRSAVEAVLKEVDARSQDDAQWAYQFKQAAKALDVRVQALEVDKGLPVATSSRSGGMVISSPGDGKATSQRIASLEQRVEDLLSARISVTELSRKVEQVGPALQDLVTTSMRRVEEMTAAAEEQFGRVEDQGQHTDGVLSSTSLRLETIEARLSTVWELGEFADLEQERLASDAVKTAAQMAEECVVVSPSTLEFTEHEDQACRTKMIISNATEHFVAFKTRVSVLHVFTVRPIEGFLRPGEVRSIEVIMRPSRQRDESIDVTRARFAIELAFPTDEHVQSDGGAKLFWAIASKGQVETFRKSVPVLIRSLMEQPQEESTQIVFDREGENTLVRRMREVDEKRAHHRQTFQQQFC